MINRQITLKINKQQRINICFGITLICFIAIMTASFVLNNSQKLNYLAYAEPNNKDLYMMQTDALAKGQVYLDVEPSEELLALENPYDPEQREGV